MREDSIVDGEVRGDSGIEIERNKRKSEID